MSTSQPIKTSTSKKVLTVTRDSDKPTGLESTTTVTTTVVTTTVSKAAPTKSKTKPTKCATTKVKRTTTIKRPTVSVAKEKGYGIAISLKADFIREYQERVKQDPKASASSLGRDPKFNFSREVVRLTLNNQEKILAKEQELGARGSTNITRIYPCKMEVVEKVIHHMFQLEIQRNIPVGDKRLKEIAFHAFVLMEPYLDLKMAPDPIGFSDGWLAKFKKRYGISMKLGYGEAGDVDMVVNGPLFEAIADQLSCFEPRNIYNCDETGLYLKVLTNKTLSDKKVVGRKPAKVSRVSILLCCNADGSDKRTPFVLSKNRPRCLDAITQEQLKTSFGGSGYMTQELFKDWLKELDADMEGRNIALVMDNAPGHTINDNDYRNITFVRLPPQTTSVSQPLDAGVIRSFKVKYSRHMIRVISDYRQTPEAANIDTPNRLLWPCLVSAWNDVTSATICNCFAHVPTIPTAMKEQLRVAVIEDEDTEMMQLKQKLKELYPGRAKAIEQQSDYGVLAYLACCKGKGPSEDLLNAITAISAEAAFKSFFLPNSGPIVVDEGEEGEDEDPFDKDYHPEIGSMQRTIVRTRSLELRSGLHDVQLPPLEYSSQETDQPSSQERDNVHSPQESQEEPQEGPQEEVPYDEERLEEAMHDQEPQEEVPHDEEPQEDAGQRLEKQMQRLGDAIDTISALYKKEKKRIRSAASSGDEIESAIQDALEIAITHLELASDVLTLNIPNPDANKKTRLIDNLSINVKVDCTLHKDERVSYRMKQLERTLNYSGNWKDDAKYIFERLVWLWSRMRNEILARSRESTSTSSNKKISL